ncbi:hypothetical protein BJX63DRAFT_136971 [Aspergillus granulosus]|uniref:Uncharacterized protein n=1 Tax=Aspergillus granulosus TaxID=176169 RepID=A0ABR4HLW3_9EURO
MPVASQNTTDTASEIAQRCGRIFDALQPIIISAQGGRLRLLNIIINSSWIKVHQSLAEMRMNLQCMMQVITHAKLKAESRSAFDESGQRKLITMLIEQHLQAAEDHHQVESKQMVDNTNESAIRQPNIAPGPSPPPSDVRRDRTSPQTPYEIYVSTSLPPAPDKLVPVTTPFSHPQTIEYLNDKPLPVLLQSPSNPAHPAPPPPPPFVWREDQIVPPLVEPSSHISEEPETPETQPSPLQLHELGSRSPIPKLEGTQTRPAPPKYAKVEVDVNEFQTPTYSRKMASLDLKVDMLPRNWTTLYD